MTSIHSQPGLSSNFARLGLPKYLLIHTLRTAAGNIANRGENGITKSTTMSGVIRDLFSSYSIKNNLKNDDLVPRTKFPHKLIERHIDPSIFDAQARQILLDMTQTLWGTFDQKDIERLMVMVTLAPDEQERIAATLSDALGTLRPLQVPLNFKKDAASKDEGDEDEELQALNDANPELGGKKPRKPKTSKADQEREQVYRQALEDLCSRIRFGSRYYESNMFPRFIAGDPRQKIESPLYMSHAIGVTRSQVRNEMQTITSRESLPDALQGAGHFGTQPMASSTYYQCSVINVEQFYQNLREHAGAEHLPEVLDPANIRDYLNVFVQRLTLAFPQASRSSHFAHVAPEYILIEARSGGLPLSLVNAFANPVVPSRVQSEDGSVSYENTLDLAIDWLRERFRLNHIQWPVTGQTLLYAAEITGLNLNTVQVTDTIRIEQGGCLQSLMNAVWEAAEKASQNVNS